MKSKKLKSNQSDYKLTDSPTVSFVIPTYNRAAWLGKTLHSVLNQTYQDFEIIVVDDGSTDGTAQLVQSFSSIQYILLKENYGVSRARNEGLIMAKGRYICFLDSDDLWDKNKLQTQVQYMEKNMDCLVCYTDEIWIRRGVRVNPMKKHQKYSGDIFRHCLPLCIVSPSSVMLRAGLFNEVGNFDESLPACEDYDLWLRIALKCEFHFIKEPLIIKHGGHADQLSRKYWGMDRFRVIALKKLLDHYPLEGERLKLTRSMMLEKCSILVQGFMKHGNKKDELRYRAIIEKYG